MKKITVSLLISSLMAANVFAVSIPDSGNSSSQQISAPTQQTIDAAQSAGTQQTQQSTTAGFSDVPKTSPNYLSISFLQQQGILGGYADGTFKPDDSVNRAEALKILLVANKIQVPDVTQTSFGDVKTTDWFAKYVEAAKKLNIVAGNPDGTFAPSRNVSRAEFLKMLLVMNGFKTEQWVGKQVFADVPSNVWFTPYLNYAGQAGIIDKDANNMVYPSQALTRGQVAEILYLMIIIRSDQNTQLLMDQTEAQMSQVDTYVTANSLILAKRASDFAVDFSQQAYKNMPTNNVVLSAAKLAKAYGYIMAAMANMANKDYTDASTNANNAVTKATEAWNVNNAIQPIAHHIKDWATQILGQIPKS